MSKLLTVKIVGFNVVGDNACEMIYQFQGSTKRIKRVMSLTEAMKKEYRVGKFLQIPVSDEEIAKIFPRQVQQVEETTIERDEYDQTAA